ncbi:glycosyl transferase family 17 [Candidatus Pelagibacter communis]|uniref:glycosyl transferase family 17 n=1 Tax=Candidatus Pelagibacter TaxID=198251 RepID=UPI003EE24AD2
MNILDCVTYFDEDIVLDLRLNILNKHVTKFIITEGAFDHRGNKRELNFDINKFSEFKDKIIYLPVTKFPNLENPWSMLEYQRNYSLNEIKKYDDDTIIIISDVDEIPNPNKIHLFIDDKYSEGVFEQNFFYYKLNLINETQSEWYGSKITRKKYLKTPNKLREKKIKQYPWWRFDKPRNIKIIKDGGWHFSFLYDVDGIIKKISSFQHTEFDKDEYKDKSTIIKKIENGEDLFNRGFKFNKRKIDDNFPEYLIKNIEKYKNWILK